MKFNFRKIASVLASVVMIGSTLGIAAAANYPAPFVAGGKADVAVVVGASAASSDFIAAADLGSSLQAELAKQTATTGDGSGATASGGDAVNLATSARKLYYADSLATARSSLSSSEMPSVLADGKVIDLKGTEYSYTQSIIPGAATSVFSTDNGNLNDPALIVNVGTTPQTGQLYNYTLSFTKNLNVSDSVNVQGQKIKILGVDYVIGASSTNTSLYLYGSGQDLSLNGGDSKTVNIGGTDHTVQLVAATDTTTAKISVDGVSKTVTEGNSYSFAGDINIYVKDVTYQSYAGGVQSAELIVGANSLLIANGASVKSGADQTTIKGTYATLAAAGAGFISGFTVSVSMPTSQKDALVAGSSYTDPVFGGLSVSFAGPTPALDSASRSKIKVSTDNNQFAFVTFTSARAGSAGEQQLTYVYDNVTSSASVQPLLAHQSVAANKGRIHVLEGENANIYDWIVVNQGDSGTILSLDEISIDSGTSGSVTLSDAITGESQKITLSNTTGTYTKSGVNFFGGNGYVINANQNGLSANITWSGSASKNVFPRIKLKDGGWISLLAATTVTNGTGVIFPDGQTTVTTSATTVTNASLIYNQNGVTWNVTNDVNPTIFAIGSNNGACNFNATIGPAILYFEPKKWNDASFGNFICVPLTTTGTTEIAIGTPALNGTNSGFQTLGSDTYKSAAVDLFGTYVTMESRTNENGVATLATPSSQMYLDVLFTTVGATVTPGSTGAGSVANLGSVTVTDANVGQVSSKNLIVVGGSCVNSVAAKILGSDAPLCGAAFTAKSNVGADQALIQVVKNPYLGADTTQIAMLVAGYEAADTTKAVKYVTTSTPSSAIGTTTLSTSGTVATIATTPAAA